MYILLIIVASITGEPPLGKAYPVVNTYTVDSMEQCNIQLDYIKQQKIPNVVIIQSGCYTKGDQL